MPGIRMAQWGVKHGHAAGKARALLANPEVELVGIYEPDAATQLLAASSSAYAGIRWLSTAAELLEDASIVAVAIEGGNAESLAMAEQAVAAGKHLWYDKPAGDDWPGFQRLMADVQAKQLHLQMGYMFRYHAGFRQISEWVKGGLLGDVFSIRAHMSTSLPMTSPGFTTTGRGDLARHRGGIFYDLAGHMLDQIVWLLGRPLRATAILHNDASASLPAFCDNSVGVLEFARAIAVVDIAAVEVAPTARRFEVYGTEGTALMGPFEPDPDLRLQVVTGKGRYPRGSTSILIRPQQRQALYEQELASFLATLRGQRPPDRPVDHELLVQETLLRATHGIGG